MRSFVKPFARHAAKRSLRCDANSRNQQKISSLPNTYLFLDTSREYQFVLCLTVVANELGSRFHGLLTLLQPPRFIATPPGRSWRRNGGLLLLHSFLSLGILHGYEPLQATQQAGHVEASRGNSKSPALSVRSAEGRKSTLFLRSSRRRSHRRSQTVKTRQHSCKQQLL